MVLSMMSGTPFACAISATVSMSRMLILGFPMLSAKSSLVFGRTARSHSPRSS